VAAADTSARLAPSPSVLSKWLEMELAGVRYKLCLPAARQRAHPVTGGGPGRAFAVSSLGGAARPVAGHVGCTGGTLRWLRRSTP
jgi:hypothetical protein